jgi:hypothetical protein
MYMSFTTNFYSFDENCIHLIISLKGYCHDVYCLWGSATWYKTHVKFNGFNNCAFWSIIVVMTLGKRAHQTPSGVRERHTCIGLMKSTNFKGKHNFHSWTCVSWIPRNRIAFGAWSTIFDRVEISRETIKKFRLYGYTVVYSSTAEAMFWDIITAERIPLFTCFPVQRGGNNYS